jgi:prolyl-tRNA synthetase
MNENKKLPDPINAFSDWYQEVIARAELAEQAPVRGCMVIRPYGFAIWELLRDELDRRIKSRGVSNACFPLFIPESYLSREKDHVEGFSPECAVVTYAGGEKLQEPLIVRPTSETIIHESMSRWINSYRDLPMRLNQWANVVRWEKRPRLFLRNTEFFWQEGHTAHATEIEAREEVSEMLDLYHDFVADTLAIPTICGVKSEREKFAGAVESSSIEGLMPDGKGLQMGTVHYLGENFSRMANVKFLDADGISRFVSMTSWGVSTRLIGALIMAHGDADGLVLPPKVAPIQVIIIPIGVKKDPGGVIAEANRIANLLRGLGLRVMIDDREGITPGAKFYHWEVRGVPLRIEIGPRDLEAKKVVLTWRVGKKKEFMEIDCLGEIPKLMINFQEMLLERADALLQKNIISVEDKEDFILRIKAQDGFIRAMWCGSDICESEIKNETSATIRNIPHGETYNNESCVWCGGKGKSVVYFAKAY